MQSPRAPNPPPIANDALHGFTPRCLTCRYELTGLPDGPCPECGTVFRHADLRAFEIARRRHNQPGPVPLAIGIAIAVVPGCWIPKAGVQILTILVMWAFVGGWLFRNRNELSGRKAVQTLWLIIPIIRSGIPLMFTVVWPAAAVLTPAAVALVVRHAWRCAPRRTTLVLTLATGIPLLLAGLLLTLQSASWLAMDHHWSPWDYPFWNTVSYPFRMRTRGIPNIEILYLGLSLCAAGLLVVISGYALLRRVSTSTRNESKIAWPDT